MGQWKKFQTLPDSGSNSYAVLIDRNAEIRWREVCISTSDILGNNTLFNVLSVNRTWTMKFHKQGKNKSIIYNNIKRQNEILVYTFSYTKLPINCCLHKPLSHFLFSLSSLSLFFPIHPIPQSTQKSQTFLKMWTNIYDKNIPTYMSISG